MRKQLLKLLLLSFGLLSSGSAWADDTYQRITSTGDLEVGKDYIIVHEDANVAMGVVSDNVGAKISVTITNKNIVMINTLAMVEVVIIWYLMLRHRITATNGQ